MKMTFNNVLRQYNKYVDNKRSELGIQGSSFLTCSSRWERKKAVIKTAICEVFVVCNANGNIINNKICHAQYTTTILNGHEDELVNHVEEMCLLEFINWWDKFSNVYIKEELYGTRGISDTNE